MVSVFLLGATGYIGGSLFVDFKKKYPDIKLTVLVRNDAHIPAITAAGAQVILGTAVSAADKISATVAQSDIVINAADCDDVALNEAILKGFKQKWDLTGRKGTLVHTSGIAIFLDGTKEGKYDADGKFYDDTDVEDIKAINTSMMHGPVDVPILKAGEEGYVNTYIVCPAAVNGVGWGPVARSSIFTKVVIRLITTLKKTVIVGEGSNVFGFVHIKDLIAFCMLLLGEILSSPDLNRPIKSGNPYERYYIVSTANIPWRTSASSIVAQLHKRGKVASTDFHNISADDPQLGHYASLLTANTLLQPQRAKRDFGWVPAHPLIEETAAEDVDELLSSS